MRCLAGLLVAVCLCGAADAALVTFTANLSADQEVHTVNSPAIGSGILTLDTVANTFSVNVMVFNMNPSTVTAAHIHVGADKVDGGVIHNFQPLLNSKTDFGTFGFSFTGSNVAITDVERDTILNSPTYINIHTQAFASGEIRGQLVNATAVPEPGTLLGLGLATVGFVGFRIRRRRLAS